MRKPTKIGQLLTENLECVDYNGTSLILIKSKNVGEVSLYDGVKYVRQGNETVKLSL